MDEEMERLADFVDAQAGFATSRIPAIEHPEEAVCFYCGAPGANALVGRGQVPGVAAHLQCWLDEPEADS